MGTKCCQVERLSFEEILTEEFLFLQSKINLLLFETMQHFSQVWCLKRVLCCIAFLFDIKVTLQCFTFFVCKIVLNVRGIKGCKLWATYQDDFDLVLANFLIYFLLVDLCFNLD